MRWRLLGREASRSSRGRLAEIERKGHTIEYRYDAFGRRIRDGELTYEPDANGNVVEIAYPGGVTANWTYDGVDRPASLIVDATPETGSLELAAAFLAAVVPPQMVDLVHERRGKPRRISNSERAGTPTSELADEVKVSRRMIAYYETETGHPPASFLADLARALNVTSDELLGLARSRSKTPAKLSSRLERRLQKIERLAPKPKQRVLQLLDTVLAAEELRHKAAGQ